MITIRYEDKNFDFDLEILSLVTGLDVVDVEKIEDNELHLVDRYDFTQFVKNLDTLTRECKEWVNKNTDYYIATLASTKHYYAEVKVFNMSSLYIQERADTELQAVLMATHWVANKKGFLNILAKEQHV